MGSHSWKSKPSRAPPVWEMSRDTWCDCRPFFFFETEKLKVDTHNVTDNPTSSINAHKLTDLHQLTTSPACLKSCSTLWGKEQFLSAPREPGRSTKDMERPPCGDATLARRRFLMAVQTALSHEPTSSRNCESQSTIGLPLQDPRPTWCVPHGRSTPGRCAPSACEQLERPLITTNTMIVDVIHISSRVASRCPRI